MAFVGLANPLSNHDRTDQTTGAPTSYLSTNRFTDATAFEPSESSTLFDQEGNGSDRSDSFNNPHKELSPEEQEAKRVSDVTQLARRITETSLRTVPSRGAAPVDNGLFAGTTAGTALDPNSPDFNYRTWAQHVLSLKKEAGFIGRTSGLAYKNLSVHGYGSALDYQKTVSLVPLQIAGWLRQKIGGKAAREQNKIQILRDFEGLVRAGEMLVGMLLRSLLRYCLLMEMNHSLGSSYVTSSCLKLFAHTQYIAAGSGCSTFLKTISGETNGIYIEGADLNYQGIGAQQMHSDFRGEATYTAEVDIHFPQMIVGDTLYFASRARSPRSPPGQLSQKAWAEHRRDVIMAVFGMCVN